MTPPLAETEDRLQTLVGCIHGLVLELDVHGRYLNAWTDDLALLARPPSELIGRTVEEILGQEEGAKFSALVKRVIATGVTETFEYSLDLNGTTRWFLADARRVVDAGGEPRVAFFARDITDRKASEQALKRSEERHRLIAQATSDVLWEWDLATDDVRWNEALHKTFGHVERTTNLAWWTNRVHPEDRDRVVASVHSFIADRSRATWREAYRFLKGDGSYAEVDDRACIVFGDAGAPIGLVGAMTDLSETRRLQSQLVHADRLAAIGTLAAGVAHEINNPLAFVLSNANYAREELERLSNDAASGLAARDVVESLREVVAALKDLAAGAERVGGIVRGLKDFCRSDETKNEPIDLRDILSFSLTMAAPQLRHRVQVSTEFADAPPVFGNAAKLGQVFLNLVINAAQALHSSKRPEAERTLQLRLRGDPSGAALVEVIDNGCGMTPEVRSRIFDPFFTTKPVGTGTGLGLSICHGIVEALRGRIEVQSEPDIGTCFTVQLPGIATDRCQAARAQDENRSLHAAA